jgi:hypothetical protein
MFQNLFIATVKCTGGWYEGETFTSDPATSQSDAILSLQDRCHSNRVSANWAEVEVYTFQLNGMQTVDITKG